jgi:uncharacterized protein (DUF2141 family)
MRCMFDKEKISGIIRLTLSCIVLTLLAACATIVSPSGGPKDETPPSVTYSNPKNRSTNFQGNRFVIGFSEYIQLVEIEKELLVSPPLSKDPDFRIKGRSLIVKMKDTLRNNTTYNFYFGNAIADITEKNPLKNYSFTFSTGSVIDSLSISGQVSDALTRLSVKDALVVLYSKTEDSVPFLEKPVYVSRTNDDGKFEFNCLASGKYRLIAFKDVNNDYLYTPKTEIVGFNDSLVEPYFIAPPDKDTTIKVQTATTPFYALAAFNEPDSIQRLQKAAMTASHLLTMAFRYPLINPVYEPLNLDSTVNWSRMEYTPARDTVNCWLLGTMPDTLRLKIMDQGTVIDTLEVATLFKPRSSGKGKSQAVDTTLKLTPTAARSGFLDWEKPCTITFANPLSSIDPALPMLIQTMRKDTLVPKIVFADSIHRRIEIRHKWQTDEEYKILLPAGTFRDVYGQINDTVRFGFKVRPKEDYGTFKVKVSLDGTPYPVILQLLNEKGITLTQKYISQPQMVDFGFLIPGKYGLKAIVDSNGNGKWDTGILLKHQQPERVLVHPKTFEVRGNWDLEEEWKL